MGLLFLMFSFPLAAQVETVMTVTPDSIPQKESTLSTTVDSLPQEERIDSIASYISVDTLDIEKIKGLRETFELLNVDYVPSVELNDTVKELFLVEEEKNSLSAEALYWVNYQRDPSMQINPLWDYRDTVIADPLFIPIIFKGEVLPEDLHLRDKNYVQPSSLGTLNYERDTIFKSYDRNKYYTMKAYRYVRDSYPQFINNTVSDLPTERISTTVKNPTIKDVPFEAKSDADFSDVKAPTKFIPERQYWTSQFESSIQFSETYVSPNWHKGGNSNLNLFTRNYMRYDYNRDKMKLTNELEIKIGINNAPKDTVHSYSFTENLLRLHSNFGYKAFNKWYYSFDGEFSTNLFTTYNVNSEKKKVALLSPATLNMGLGMKYDLNKTLKGKNRSVVLAINIAPLSYTYRFSTSDDIIIYTDPISKKAMKYRHQFGSTVRAQSTVNFNQNVRWTSRFYYFTSYQNVVGEFENTLDLAISRYFSTRIYLHIRYDDSLKKSYKDATKTDLYDTFFQTNQMLSFGFNYRW